MDKVDNSVIHEEKAKGKHRTGNLVPAPDVAKKMQPITKPDFDSLLHKAASQRVPPPEPEHR